MNEYAPYCGLFLTGRSTDPPNVVVAEDFPGKVTHSHDYRVPEPFAGQTVVIVGAGASAQDISRELSKHVRNGSFSRGVCPVVGRALSRC